MAVSGMKVHAKVRHSWIPHSAHPSSNLTHSVQPHQQNCHPHAPRGARRDVQLMVLPHARRPIMRRRHAQVSNPLGCPWMSPHMLSLCAMMCSDKGSDDGSNDGSGDGGDCARSEDRGVGYKEDGCEWYEGSCQSKTLLDPTLCTSIEQPHSLCATTPTELSPTCTKRSKKGCTADGTATCTTTDNAATPCTGKQPTWMPMDESSHALSLCNDVFRQGLR